MQPSGSVKVFISYAHADQELHRKLGEHLSAMKRSGKITIWQDQEIPAGEDWENQINTHLNEADVILLLVSSSFIASNYCWNKEVMEALKRHEAGTARVIPIILKPADWQDTPLGQLQALPTGVKPVTQWNDQDAALDNVVRGIRKVVEDLRSTLWQGTRKNEEANQIETPIRSTKGPTVPPSKVQGPVVTLECLGDLEKSRFLDGRTGSGTVGLVPSTVPLFPGAFWDLKQVSSEVYTLRCLGNLEGPRFLDGRTSSGTVGLVLFAVPPFTGAFWELKRVSSEAYTLKCLGDIEGSRFLDGRTADGTVGLIPSAVPPFTGAFWELKQASSGAYTLKCLGDIEGSRFLDGRTANGTVDLVPSAVPPFTGAFWELKQASSGAYTLKCLGHLEGSRFLNGRTADGTVDLALDTDRSTQSGTYWELKPFSDRAITLKCLGDFDGNRYLEGRTDGTLGLAPAPGGTFTGTLWRISTSIT